MQQQVPRQRACDQKGRIRVKEREQAGGIPRRWESRSGLSHRQGQASAHMCALTYAHLHKHTHGGACSETTPPSARVHTSTLTSTHTQYKRASNNNIKPPISKASLLFHPLKEGAYEVRATT